ncbi:Ionotropic glutamate receptor [Dillenia turbinata]|uniref:Ionotropic glutamate receptor n=1 Tax=Dillenia turbinata TaxID=194707 RepID=A0AAN8VR28_9MAGN
MGKEQKIAMQMALHDFQRLANSSNLVLHLQHSHAQAASTAIQLIKRHKVQAIIGTISVWEASLVRELTGETPVVSLNPTATSRSSDIGQRGLAYFNQMGRDILVHTECIAAIVGQFGWRRVTAIYEDNSASGIITQLSDSLKVAYAVVAHHTAISKVTMEDELKKLRQEHNRVFVVLQTSLSTGILLFQTARKLNMTDKGYVWIVSDEIASFLDSLNSSDISSLQGFIGFKSFFVDNNRAFREFKLKFRKMYESAYPEEAEYAEPSFFAVRAYDATFLVAKQINNSRERSVKLKELILSGDYEGLSGKIEFKNGELSETPKFSIVNIVGKRYRELALWTPEGGFLNNYMNYEDERLCSVFWPGGLVTVPRGWTSAVLEDNQEEKPLRIGVPATGAFNMFVRVYYNPDHNQTYVSGFSIEVFEAVVGRLPYHLPYVLIPYYGTYDEMVHEVFNKLGSVNSMGSVSLIAISSSISLGFDVCFFALSAVLRNLLFSISRLREHCQDHALIRDETGPSFLGRSSTFKVKCPKFDWADSKPNRLDAAVGDTEIMSNRFQYVEFTQPYVDSGLVMVVPVKPSTTDIWIFVKIFSARMWILMALMTLLTGLAIVLIEWRKVMEELKGDDSLAKKVGKIWWFPIAVLFFQQREKLDKNLSYLVLGPWYLFLSTVVAALTANLSAIMTVKQLQPSVVSIEELKGTNAGVGCNGNSFIVKYLIDVLDINPKNIRRINSIDEYPEAFTTKKIAAGFFVVPHAEVFLAKYCHGYMTAGKSYKLGGFGFAFPKGSYLATDISEAILKVTEEGEMAQLKKDFLSMFNCTSSSSTDVPPIDPEPFSALFLLAGCLASLALLIRLYQFISKLKIWTYLQGMLIRRRPWRDLWLFHSTLWHPRSQGEDPIP